MVQVTEKQQEVPVRINTAWCKGCGICVFLCPQGVLKLKQGKAFVYDPIACVKCRNCELHCPDFAIQVERGEAK
ncbi:MAG TPA: 4Fe-4S binding protein [Clostridia bacterium]|nr:4Fe-4S binding protein [Clostridia bacterium]